MVKKAKSTTKDKAVDVNFAGVTKKLLAKAKKGGKIDQRDIFALIPDLPANVEALDALYSQLAEQNLQIVSATEPNAAEFTAEWAEDEEEIVLDDQTYLDLSLIHI